MLCCCNNTRVGDLKAQVFILGPTCWSRRALRLRPSPHWQRAPSRPHSAGCTIPWTSLAASQYCCPGLGLQRLGAPQLLGHCSHSVSMPAHGPFRAGLHLPGLAPRVIHLPQEGAPDVRSRCGCWNGKPSALSQLGLSPAGMCNGARFAKLCGAGAERHPEEGGSRASGRPPPPSGAHSGSPCTRGGPPIAFLCR